MRAEAEVAFDPRRQAHRRPGLDLLRALAIWLVVLYHAGIFGFELPLGAQRFGWIGVDLFFVLSGYLIAGQLFKVIASGHPIDIRQFYRRRALRILPAYLVAVALYFSLPLLWRDYPTGPPLWKFLTFTQNLGLDAGTHFSHAWSLCIEFQFYLALPFLILTLTRLRRAPFAIVPAVLVGEIVLRAFLARANSAGTFSWWHQWIYYPTYSRLDGLTIGVGLAALEIFRPEWWKRLTNSAGWIWLPGIAAIVVALFLAEDSLSVASSSLGFSLVALGMGTLLVCALSPRLPLSRVAIPGAAFFATIAYSVYLTHKLAIHWLQNFAMAHAIGVVPSYFLMLMSIFVLGSTLFLAVERPFLRIREKQSRRPT